MELSTILLLCLLGLFLLWIGYLVGKAVAKASAGEREEAVRKEALSRSRAVLKGQVNEQLAPYLPDFPWRASEARFIGKPIDFLVFTGLDSRKVDEIVFVEVKTGGSRLSEVERSVKGAVEAGKVRWAEYRPRQ